MYTGRNFPLRGMLVWTRYYLFTFLLMSTAVVVLYEIFELKWLALPWVPIALIGTAVAFLIGFKNNASYGRTWEARKIYGGIVNTSRSFTAMVRDFASLENPENGLDEAALREHHRRAVKRHVAWMTALRFQLRSPRPWESIVYRSKGQYTEKVTSVEEQKYKIEEFLEPIMEPEEYKEVISKKNRATQILGLQSKHLKELYQLGALDNFRLMELQKMITEMYTLQGKCERIKNFPYPRQFASLNMHFVWLFLVLVPFGLVKEFAKLGGTFIWLTIPISMIVCWTFHTMERIGEVTENPFMGGVNDVPITSISRGIEIDLLELIDEKELPEGIPEQNNTQM